MITRTHCMQFVGQHVVFGTSDGIHHGILHAVKDDGILVRPVGGGTTRLVSASGVLDAGAGLLHNLPQASDDIREAWFPFLFFPLFALLWLLPWAWWW